MANKDFSQRIPTFTRISQGTNLRKLVAICYLLFADCYLLFAIGYLLLAICYLLFAIAVCCSVLPFAVFCLLVDLRTPKSISINGSPALSEGIMCLKRTDSSIVGTSPENVATSPD